MSFEREKCFCKSAPGSEEFFLLLDHACVVSSLITWFGFGVPKQQQQNYFALNES